MRPFSARTLLVAVGAIALLLLTACTSAENPKGSRVTVSRVSSGQMVEVLDPASSTPLATKVRLLGLDAPAWKQEPWFTEAREALDALLNDNQPVVLEFDAQPQVVTKTGNTLKLAYVWKDGLLLNEEMLKQGWGLASSFAPNTKYEHRLAQAQEKARLLGLGIWNPEQPMREMPKEFRKANSSDS
jgi:micrococcal nuclease